MRGKSLLRRWLVAITATAVTTATVGLMPMALWAPASAADTATVTPGLAPDAYSCSQRSYIDFEGLPDGTNLSTSSVSGVEFTTTGGYTWMTGDFATGGYNGKYPSGQYTSQGTSWAWLGTSQGAGRIDFSDGPVSQFSLLVSAGTGVQLEAYNVDGNLLATAGPSSPNTNTGTMAELKIARTARDIDHLLVHDSGNYFLVDAVCSDATGTGTVPIGDPLNPSETYGPGNAAEYDPQCRRAQPVNCATGNFFHVFSDLQIPGRGVPLDLNRTYNALAASQDSPFGYGWSSSYTMHLSIAAESGVATVHQEHGSTLQFHPNASGGYSAAPRVQAQLTRTADGGFKLVRRHQVSFLFDAQGRLLEQRDLNGYTTTLSYSGDQLETVSDPSGRTLAFSYDADGKVSEVTDPTGRAVAYGYNAAGELVSVTDVAGGTWSFGYDTTHQMTSMTDPRGGTVSNIYDSAGRVTSQTDAMGRTTTFDYAGNALSSESGTTTITEPDGDRLVETYTNGQLGSLTEAAGTAEEATWFYSYDPLTMGRSRIVDPTGAVTAKTYDRDGNVISVTDPLGRTTRTTYNDLDQPLVVTDPDDEKTTFSYDGSGNLTTLSRTLQETGQQQATTFHYADPTHPGDVTSVEDPTGGTWTFDYDTHGYVSAVTDPTGSTAASIHDVLGRVTQATTAEGRSTSFELNAFGDVTETVDPLGNRTSVVYDANRNRVRVTDAAGEVTKISYNADDEVTQVTRPDGSKIGFGYDTDGNLTRRTDAAGNVTSYTFGPRDLTNSTSDPLGRSTSYGYDPAGRPATITDPAGQVTNLSYDPAGQLIHIGYSDPATSDVDLTYTTDGLRKSMTDGTGTTSYAYDSLDRLVQVTGGDGKTVGYGYDLADRVTALTYPNGKAITRAYDPAGRLISTEDWAGSKVGFSYDKDGNLAGEQFPNGVTTTIDRDPSAQISRVSHSNAAGVLASFTYQRDSENMVTSASVTGLDLSDETFGYDTLDQIVDYNSQPLSYDAADNPTQLASGATLTYDAAGQVTGYTANGQSIDFSYDERGNRRDGLTPDGVHVAYTYDQANRLASVQGGGSGSPAGLLAGGVDHSLAVRSDGTVWAWGGNSGGQLGLGNTTDALSPTQVPGLSNATQVAAGAGHSLIVRSDGTVAGWGQNGSGQLGDGTTTSRTSPTQVHDVSGAIAVAAGNYHSLALHQDGTVSAWGLGNAGQLGTGTAQSSTVPVAVTGLTDVIAIAAGGLPGWAGHSLALKQDGTVWAWGYGKSGQLGQGDNVSQLAPVQVSGLSGITAVAAAGDNSYALAEDGTVWAWGDNSYGQLGNPGARHTQNTPMRVQGLPNNVETIAAGGTHALAVTADGEVWTWGNNNTGQLGDGAQCGKTCQVPVHVTDITKGAAIAGGYVHTLATDTDGNVYGWGSNSSGQIGDDTTRARTTPVRVAGLDEVTSSPNIDTNYTYNGDGLRQSATTSGSTHQFAWDLTGGLPLVLTDGDASYLYGPGGAPIAQIKTDGTTTYLHADQLGSTRLITGADGKVAATYSYSPHGQTITKTGTAQTPLQWAGQYHDAQTGLYYMRARYYDSTTAQFLTRDPLISITGAAYKYASNNPTNFSDPTGLDPFFGALGAAIGAVAGGVVGAVGYIVDTQISGADFSWQELAGSTVGGVVGGAISGGCIGLTNGLGAVACNAAAGAAGEFVTQAIDGQGFNPVTIGVSAGLGAVGSFVPDPFHQVGFRPYLMHNVYKPGKNAMRQYGNAFIEGGITAATMGLVNHWQRASFGSC